MSEKEDIEGENNPAKHPPIVLNNTGDSKIVKKGLLWHQNDTKRSLRNIFKHKWKQRYFILTNAYLACFKKRKSKISEMGLFLFRLGLSDIESIAIVNECLNINNDRIILWDGSNSVLNEWYNYIKDAKSSCLKEMQSNSSQVDKPSPIIDTKRLSRISVLSSFDQRLSISSSSSSSQITQDLPTLPRFASQYKGVVSSQSSHFNTTRPDYHLRPCPFTLSISPSLTQRSLYAQKILSSSSSPNPTPTHSKIFRPFTKATLPSANSSSFLQFATQPRLHPSLKSAASEFSFISLGSTSHAEQPPVSNYTPDSVAQSPSHKSLHSDSPPPVPPPRILVRDRMDRNSPRPLSSYFLELAAANSSSASYSSASSCNSSTLPHRNNIPTSPLILNKNFVNHRPNQKRKARMNRIIESSSRKFL